MKNTTYEVTKSNEYFKKAKEVIPGGIFGHYKYAVRDTGPKFFSRSEGAYFWDLDDNRYVDLMCGCLLYTSPSPRDLSTSRMPSSA